MSTSLEYSIVALLPAEIDRKFKQWTTDHGSTWAPWGGHISLVTRFELSHNATPQDMVDHIGAVCRKYPPIPLNLNQITREDHWRRPQFDTVLLLGDPTLEGVRTTQRLQAALMKSLAPITTNLYPEIVGRPYKPHLTLTIGVPTEDANRLANQARQDNLHLDVTLERITLLGFDTSNGDEHNIQTRRSFELSR